MKYTTESFIEKALAVHGGKYSYDKTQYVKLSKKVVITCEKHGDFMQLPSGHLAGKGCYACSKESTASKLSTQFSDFVASARLVHGDKFSYHESDYSGMKKKARITCGKHGDFWQEAYDHVNGRGCRLCSYEVKSKSNSMGTDAFIRRAKLVHGEKYDYSRVEYKNSSLKVVIGCPEHGFFEQIAKSHIDGFGCKQCAYGNRLKTHGMSTDDFIIIAKLEHGDKYDYRKVSYSGCRDTVTINCREHGEFDQQAYVHLSGHGCPSCANSSSRGENEVFELIKRYCPDARQRVRDVIPPMELDIYIPDLNLAIEYNGEFWHSVDKRGKGYHLNKRHACESAGVRLISICETDWKTKRERVERIIINAIGKLSGKTVYARKCTIREVVCNDYRAFMNENHIQGYAIATHRYGLYHNDVLVACMAFKRLKSGVWDCVRYATSCRVPGGHSKLFKFMARELGMETAQSFVDMDFFTGSSYREEDGWTDSGAETVGFRVWHQKYGFMSRQMWWKDFIPATLEKIGADHAIYDRDKNQRQMMAEAGCLVIENSGNKKFVWHK